MNRESIDKFVSSLRIGFKKRKVKTHIHKSKTSPSVYIRLGIEKKSWIRISDHKKRNKIPYNIVMYKDRILYKTPYGDYEEYALSDLPYIVHDIINRCLYDLK